MKIAIKELRRIIREELLREAKWKAWRIKSGQRQGDPLDIDAPSTTDAAQKASQEYEKLQKIYVDPFTIDVVPANQKPKVTKENRYPTIIKDLEGVAQFLRVNGLKGVQGANHALESIGSDYGKMGDVMFSDRHGRQFDMLDHYRNNIVGALADKDLDDAKIKDIIQDIEYAIDAFKRGPLVKK